MPDGGFGKARPERNRSDKWKGIAVSVRDFGQIEVDSLRRRGEPWGFEYFAAAGPDAIISRGARSAHYAAPAAPPDVAPGRAPRRSWTAESAKDGSRAIENQAQQPHSLTMLSGQSRSALPCRSEKPRSARPLRNWSSHTRSATAPIKRRSMGAKRAFHRHPNLAIVSWVRAPGFVFDT